MPTIITKNYTKKQYERTKILAYTKLFFSFPRLKMYFNYLTVCEMLKKTLSNMS